MSASRILVVEDDESIQKLEQRILEEAGYNVDCASSGTQAMEYIEQARYNVVVADVMMPGMDGFDLTREIEKKYGKSVPVLLVTAVHDALKVAKERQVKPVSALQKPFTPAALLTAVKLLESRGRNSSMLPNDPLQKAKPKRKKKEPKKGWLEKLISK